MRFRYIRLRHADNGQNVLVQTADICWRVAKYLVERMRLSWLLAFSQWWLKRWSTVKKLPFQGDIMSRADSALFSYAVTPIQLSRTSWTKASCTISSSIPILRWGWTDFPTSLWVLWECLEGTFMSENVCSVYNKDAPIVSNTANWGSVVVENVEADADWVDDRTLRLSILEILDGASGVEDLVLLLKSSNFPSKCPMKSLM